MDITDAPPQRLDIAVEHFLGGHSLGYHNVTFCWDNQQPQPELLVLSYSDCIHLENVRHEEAKEKIQRSKLIAEDLAERSPAFKSSWENTRIRFQFCFDYGKGAILLAEEFAGQIIWKGK